MLVLQDFSASAKELLPPARPSRNEASAQARQPEAQSRFAASAGQSNAMASIVSGRSVPLPVPANSPESERHGGDARVGRETRDQRSASVTRPLSEADRYRPDTSLATFGVLRQIGYAAQELVQKRALEQETRDGDAFSGDAPTHRKMANALYDFVSNALERFFPSPAAETGVILGDAYPMQRLDIFA